MFIADKKFNIIFESPAFDSRGHFTEIVVNTMKEKGIDPDRYAEMRTEDNIEQLRENILRDFKLEQIYEKRRQNNHA